MVEVGSSSSDSPLPLDCGAITAFKDRGFGYVSRTLASKDSRAMWFHISTLKRHNSGLAYRVDRGDLSDTWLWYRIDGNKVGEFYRHCKDVPPDLRRLAEQRCRERFLCLQDTPTEALKKAATDLLGDFAVEALIKERQAEAEAEVERRKMEKERREREAAAYIEGVKQTLAFLRNHALNRRQAQIRDICAKRKIQQLVHFTKVCNVPSILKHGLHGRSSLERSGISFDPNDKHRLDKWSEAVCISISFPNYKMFYRYRQIYGENFAVLVLKPEVLWAYACMFCRGNAASSRVTAIPIEERLSADSLESMFGDHPNVARDSLPIPPSYPTDPQAEVLVIPHVNSPNYLGPDGIHPAFIDEVHVNEPKYADQIRQAWNDPLDRAIVSSGSPYFRPRIDWGHWQQDNGFDWFI